jgi:amino acid transporter
VAPKREHSSIWPCNSGGHLRHDDVTHLFVHCIAYHYDGAVPDAKEGESGGSQRQLAQDFRLRDLVPLSVSSVGPMFSVAATGGVLAAQAGWWSLVAIALCAVPFVLSAFIFRALNHYMPHAGASFHWSGRVIGRGLARYQAGILLLAYFISIPPIAIPAASYTLALVAPGYRAPRAVELAAVVFWMVFAAIPLLLGARLTARVTGAFFALEVVSLAGFAALGAVRWPAIHVAVHVGHFPVGGVLTAAVVVATILDGWEISAYASEESARPRANPGTSGIIGIVIALGFYAILYPMVLAEVPLHALTNSTDPLTAWSGRMVPGARWLILVPVLGSTAGGLWLTTFILSRILYAQGREGLVPGVFARLNRHRVPHIAVVVSLGAAFVVVSLQVLVASLGSFFDLVLSAAGFFLLAEFFLDSITATVFLTVGHRRVPEAGIDPRRHRALRVVSIVASLLLAGLMVTFFVYGPRTVGNGIDEVIGTLLVASLAFAWWTRHRGGAPVVFTGHDIHEVEQVGIPPYP